MARVKIVGGPKGGSGIHFKAGGAIGKAPRPSGFRTPRPANPFKQARRAVVKAIGPAKMPKGVY